MARRALYDELIGELADRGTSALVTTHDLEGIEPIADRVAVLHRDPRKSGAAGSVAGRIPIS